MYHCKMDVLMVARYFTPQHGLKGWSERGATSGVAHITKGRGKGPCNITIQSLYRANGFANFRSCGTDQERKLVLRFSIETYERKPEFSLPFGKYWSKLQSVSE